MLQTAFKLLVIAKHHIKCLFVLTLPVNKSLEPLARNFYFLPGRLSPFISDFLVALRVVQKHFLLADKLYAIRPWENTGIRVSVLEISQVLILGEHAIIWEAKNIVAIRLLPFFIEVLKAEIIVVKGSPPDKRLLDYNSKLAHFENNLVTDVIHYLLDGVGNHLLQNFRLGLNLVAPVRIRQERVRGLVVASHDGWNGDHLIEVLRHVLLVVDANQAMPNLVLYFRLVSGK